MEAAGPRRARAELRIDVAHVSAGHDRQLHPDGAELLDELTETRRIRAPVRPRGAVPVEHDRLEPSIDALCSTNLHSSPCFVTASSARASNSQEGLPRCRVTFRCERNRPTVGRRGMWRPSTTAIALQ